MVTIYGASSGSRWRFTRPEVIEMTRRLLGRTMPFVLVAMVALGVVLAGLAFAAPTRSATSVSPAASAPDPHPPAATVKLVFIHHSTGEAWLDDGHGRLGLGLRNSNYFVSDTNYGWGPDGIGDHTDIGDWWTWFRGPAVGTYTLALFVESGQNCSYSRLASDPGGQNTVVMFKSCFPNSELGDPLGPIPAIGANPMKGRSAGDPSYTVANAKGIYRDLLQYFRLHTDKLFVLVVSPPMTTMSDPANARALADWLVASDGWLSGYPYTNVAVFDYYNVLTAPGNHHRYDAALGAVEDVHPVASDVLAYPSGADSHPNATGDIKATAEFVPILNIAYNRWRASTRAPARTIPRCPARISVQRPGLTRSSRTP
jgi:hypothetical protein